MKAVFRTFLIASLVFGCSGADPSLGAEQDLGQSEQPFLAYQEVGPLHIYLGTATTHGAITKGGLSFLDEDVAADIAGYNEDTDTGVTQKDSRYHNDNCQLAEAFASVRDRYDQAVSFIGANQYEEAKKVFGTILHTAQDFYAHSNWVEASQPRSFTFNHKFEYPSLRPGDPFGSPFGSMVVLEQGAPNWVIALPPHNRVPTAWTDRGSVTGLITGTYDNSDGTLCLPQASIPHGVITDLLIHPDADIGTYLTKDLPDLPYHPQAVQRAVDQTKEEFCRFARLVLLRRGKAVHDEFIQSLGADPAQYQASCGEPYRNVEALTVAFSW